MKGLPEKVTIRDEAARDGFQNEKVIIPTEDKVKLINAILDSGVPGIQVTSFVHPKWIPQLADAEDVLARVNQKADVEFSVLVPNIRGLQRALDVKKRGLKCDEAGIVVSATESHSKSNLSRSITEALAELPDTIKMAHDGNLRTRVSISVAFGCTMEGKVPMQRVMDIARQIKAAGADEITLSDTTGMANPRQVYDYFKELRTIAGDTHISAHFHDTRGLGVANVLAAMQAGITTFDSCVGGLGGCPYAPGASGNVATEDVVNMMEQMGIETGIDLGKLIECARMAETLVNRTLPSHVKQAG